jgi:hypothetical protein
MVQRSNHLERHSEIPIVTSSCLSVHLFSKKKLGTVYIPVPVQAGLSSKKYLADTQPRVVELLEEIDNPRCKSIILPFSSKPQRRRKPLHPPMSPFQIDKTLNAV